MEEKTFLQKFITDEKSKVGWLVCISTGSPVRNDSNWLMKDGSIINEGYKAVRFLKGNYIYKVVCAIEKTTLGLPLYRTTAYKLLENNTFSSSHDINITALKMTSVSNQIIKELNVDTTKRWSGVKFFGLDRTDVKHILKTTDKPLTKAAENLEEASCSSNVDELYADGRDNCPWVGVQSFGHVVTGEFFDLFIKVFNGQKCFLSHVKSRLMVLCPILFVKLMGCLSHLKILPQRYRRY